MDSNKQCRTSLISDAPWLQPDSFLSRLQMTEFYRVRPRLSPVTWSTLRNTKFINILFTPALFHFH